MTAKFVVLGAVLLLAGSTAAFACKGTTNSALDENFQKPDAGWGTLSDASTSISAQGLAMKPPAGSGWWQVNSNYTVDGADLCLQIVMATVPPGADKQYQGDVGMIFWLKDANNFYTATIALDGTFSIDRLINSQWSAIVSPTPSSAIKTAAGALNEVELTINGNAGSFYVNGTKVDDFRGQAPADGGPPGIYCESGDTTTTTWVFPRFQIY